MSAVRINMVVEGQTEKAFVDDVLAETFGERGIELNARCVLTSRDRHRTYRGGLVSYAKARADVVEWLRQESAAYCATMFDLYALPDEFPGWTTRPEHGGGAAKARHLEAAFAADVNDRRFIPHIQPHEFEALLFSDPERLDAALCLDGRPPRLATLNAALAEYGAPEDINERPEKAPSKRFLPLGYDKTVHGPLVASDIGLPALRARCPHFGAWIARLLDLPPL